MGGRGAGEFGGGEARVEAGAGPDEAGEPLQPGGRLGVRAAGVGEGASDPPAQVGAGGGEQARVRVVAVRRRDGRQADGAVVRDRAAVGGGLVQGLPELGLREQEGLRALPQDGPGQVEFEPRGGQPAGGRGQGVLGALGRAARPAGVADPGVDGVVPGPGVSGEPGRQPVVRVGGGVQLRRVRVAQGGDVHAGLLSARWPGRRPGRPPCRSRGSWRRW